MSEMWGHFVLKVDVMMCFMNSKKKFTWCEWSVSSVQYLGKCVWRGSKWQIMIGFECYTKGCGFYLVYNREWLKVLET